ncbi:MAG: hypothetical protein KJ967_06160 [Elusimicrobia bacterium]|nr:hypothetical protein [Elusimicrobiota bacterium]
MRQCKYYILNNREKEVIKKFVCGVLSSFIVIVIILQGCAPALRMDLLKSYPPINYDIPIRVYSIYQPVPQDNEELGIVKIDDTGFSVNCTYKQVVEIAKEKARAVGGNAIHIIQIKEPDGWSSTCYRITARILRVRTMEPVMRDVDEKQVVLPKDSPKNPVETVNFVDIETGKIVKSYDQKAKDVDELRLACKKLAEQLSR